MPSASPRIDTNYRRRARLKGGLVVQLRLIGPQDRERFVAGFERLSPESRYRRFFTPVTRLREDAIDHLLDTDNHDHLALGAEMLGANGQPVGPIVGVARYIRLRDQPEVAEAAVTVGDDLQHRGLGRLMLSVLVRAAVERDIRRFRAHVMSDNTPVLKLLRSLNTSLQPVNDDSGALVYEFELPETSPRSIREEPMYAVLRTSARKVRRTIDLAAHLPWLRKWLHEAQEWGDELSAIGKGRSMDVNQTPVDAGEDD